MIEELVIDNCLSVVHAELRLQPLTVLVGPNNAGKTNVLRIIKLLSDIVGETGGTSVTRNVDRDFLNRETGRDVFVIRVKTRVGSLELRAKSTGKDRSFHIGGALSVDPGNGGKPRPATADDLQLFRRELRASPVFSFELESLKRWCDLRERSLDPSGEGLARTLFHLQSKDPARWEALQEEFREYLPDLNRITFDSTENGQVVLGYWEKGSSKPTSINAISDGILLLTALLAVRYSEDASILLLEEPERGIHPRRLEEVTQSFKALASSEDPDKEVQVILTSHSPYFLDRFKDSPESVIVVDRGPDHGTVCRPLTERLKELPALRDASLGELWYSGVLGGVPPAA